MRQKDWGRIIFISSESAVNIPAEMIHYGVTKTAQVSFARGLAETTAGSEVTVNSVLAGPTKSEGVENFVQGLATSQSIDQAPGGTGVLPERPTLLITQALRHTGGSSGDGRVCCQPAIVSHKWGSVAG
jgi:NAD(P)-dependent dehydrogenase (short-subunit alcohol dehydrogenase family)